MGTAIIADELQSTEFIQMNPKERTGVMEHVSSVLTLDTTKESQSDLKGSLSAVSDLEVNFTLSGTNTDALTDKETLALATKLNLKYQEGKLDLKGKRHAGIAPTRFNLNKYSFGKYVARIVFQHRWKSQRARLYWHKLRVYVLKSGSMDFLDLEDDEDDDYNRSMVQGFKCHQILKRPVEIVSTIFHHKIPVHCQDGSLGLESEIIDVTKERNDAGDDDENFFDTNLQIKKQKNYSIISTDAKHNLTMWDISSHEPYLSIKMDHHFSLITFISKHYMFAGLMDQKTIKFFTSKLHITSGVICGHDVQSLQYFAPKNELVATGTHEISIWTIDGVLKGDLCIVPTLRLHIIPKLKDDEWIDLAYILHERKQLWVVVNMNILIYDYVTGSYLHTIRNVTARRISCIAHHSEYQYILVGCVDGTIKVINIVNATVHEFVSHCKAVVAISVFPEGPLVVSCSVDQTLRLYNLKYFKEISSVNIKDRPIGMNLMDDVYLYIQTRSNIQVWATNQFNINFTTMTSPVTKLLYTSDKKKLPKIIARTGDGMNRILSPATGRAITSNLPLLETDTVIHLAYALALDRLFILLESGEIWVFRTDQNPCTIVDIWKSEEAKSESCSSLVICQAMIDDESRSMCPPQLEAYSILLGATKNGHVLVFGRGGAILDRYQLHMGAITQMVFDDSSSCLYTSGLDDNIRISVIRPLHPDMIQPKIEIQTNFVPRLLCPMGNIIAATADDASIHMFEVNLAKQEWKIMMGHPKMHDHTQKVNTLICCRPLGIFLSSAMDHSLRIWNHRNKLLREIYFQEPIESICIANDRGDVLLAMGNRIDLVRSIIYLPPVYQKLISQIGKVDKELPLLFDDSLIPFTRPQTFQFRERQKVLYDKTSPLEIFCNANLPWFDKVSNIRRKGMLKPSSPNHHGVHDLLHYAEDPVEAFLKRAAAQVRQKRIDKENLELAKLRQAEENSKIVSSIPEVPTGRSLLKEFDLMIPMMMQQEPSKKFIEASDSEEDESHPLEGNGHARQRTQRLIVAPDGFVPNTMVEKETTRWLQEHGFVTQGPTSFKSRKKKLVGKAKDSDKEARSREYRQKLKDKMRELISREEEESATTAPVEEMSLPVEAKQVMEVELKKQIVEMTLPETVEKFMGYDWFPEELVFYPEGFEPSPLTETICTTSKGKVTRVPKITGKADEIYPIVLRVFSTIPVHKRGELMQFLHWLKNEHGFQNTIPFQRFIIARLEPIKIKDSDDMQARMNWIDWMLELNPNNADFLLVLLHYTTCLYDTLKNRAIQILSSMGIPCISDPFVTKTIESICEEWRQKDMPGSSHESPRLFEIFEKHVRSGIRNYLIYTSPDPELAKKIQSLDPNGQEVRAATAAKKKKKGKENGSMVLTGGSEAALSQEFQLPPRDFNAEDPEQVKEKAEKVQQALMEMRKQNFSNSLDERIYKKIPFEVTDMVSDRPPEDILTSPGLVDYINGFNFHLYYEKLRLEAKDFKEQQERLLAKQKEELAALEAKRRTEEIALRAKLAAEREALEKQRKERIQMLKLAKQGLLPPTSDSTSKKKKIKFSEMQTLGVGKTHQSCCHESREVLDAAYRGFENRNELKQIGFVNSSLTTYLKSMNRAMPIEKVRLDPFDIDSSIAPPKPSTAKPRVQSSYGRYEPKPRKKVEYDSRTELDYIQDALSKKTVSEREADFIRGDLQQAPHIPGRMLPPLSQTGFQATRKYFIPSLTFVQK